MDFWDLLKKHYDTGRPAPQGKDWEAMEELIQAQPELQPSPTSIRWAGRILLLSLLLISSSTGPWQPTSPQPLQSPYGLERMEARGQKKISPALPVGPKLPETSPMPSGAAPIWKGGQPEISAQDIPQLQVKPKKIRKISPSMRPLAASFPAPAQEKNTYAQEESAPPAPAPAAYSTDAAPHKIGTDLSQLAFRDLHAPQITQPQKEMSFMADSSWKASRATDLAGEKSPLPQPGQWALGWELAYEQGFQTPSKSTQQGLFLRYRRDDWSLQLGLKQGWGQFEVAENRQEEWLQVDSLPQEEIVLRLQQVVNRTWIIDSFFQGSYRYDTVYLAQRDTLRSWRVDSTRITGEYEVLQDYRARYRSLPLMLGHHWDWDRWELLAQGGLRLEHRQWRRLDRASVNQWSLRGQVHLQLLYHWSPHWQLGAGAGLNAPLGTFSGPLKARNTRWSPRIQLVYTW